MSERGRQVGGILPRRLAGPSAAWAMMLVVLGDFDFAAGTDGYVKITLNEKGTLYADAVKFLPADKVDKTAFPSYPAPDGSTPRAVPPAG